MTNNFDGNSLTTVFPLPSGTEGIGRHLGLCLYQITVQMVSTHTLGRQWDSLVLNFFVHCSRFVTICLKGSWKKKQTVYNYNDINIYSRATKDDSFEGERCLAVRLESVTFRIGTDFQFVVLERNHVVADGLGRVVGHLDRNSSRLAHSHVP